MGKTLFYLMGLLTGVLLIELFYRPLKARLAAAEAVVAERDRFNEICRKDRGSRRSGRREASVAQGPWPPRSPKRCVPRPPHGDRIGTHPLRALGDGGPDGAGGVCGRRGAERRVAMGARQLGLDLLAEGIDDARVELRARSGA